MTDRMCQKQFVKFCAGDFSLDSAPWSGRPVEVDSNQIKTLIENNQHYTTWEVAEYSKYPNHKVIGESEKFFILQKILNGLFGQPNIC